MQQKNGKNWNYESALSCMLLFVQRVDELLFHHTLDTYRYPSLSLRGLAIEFCSVYFDSQKGLIDKKNLPHIIDEFADRLEKDPLAKEILTSEYVKRFIKNYGSWDIKQQFENINYVGRKISNRTYYNFAVRKLKELIAENKKKKDLEQLTKIWVKEVIDNGYNADYVYKTLHEVFYHDEVKSLDSLDVFFSKFDFSNKQYDVYIGFQKDLSPIKPLFEKLILNEGRLLVLRPDEVQSGIKIKKQKTILKFESVTELDMFSAFENAYEIALHVVDSYSFFRHDGSIIRTYSQVVCPDKSIIRIRQKQLLKQRVRAQSQLDSEKNADLLLSALFSNYTNRSDLRRIIKIHNSALKSGSINDSLLSLWSLVESLVDTANNYHNEYSVEKDDEVRKSKSGSVIEYMMPFLKSTYVCKLVNTCAADIKLWDQDFFNTEIANIEYGDNELEKTFAFLAFSKTQDIRNKLYASTDQYPLLKFRVMMLSETFNNSKHLKFCVAEHEKRIRWHLQRIYRARNYIIHDGSSNDKMNNDLVINLHSYIDTTIFKIVEMLNESPYDDSITSVLSEHRIEVSIFDEIMKDQPKEEINENNAKKYLYYDYRK